MIFLSEILMSDFLFRPRSKASGRPSRTKKIIIKIWLEIMYFRIKIQLKWQKNNVKYLIVGIGLNLVKSPKIKNYPTTNLYDLTKNKIKTNQIIRELKYIYINFFKSLKAF